MEDNTLEKQIISNDLKKIEEKALNSLRQKAFLLLSAAKKYNNTEISSRYRGFNLYKTNIDYQQQQQDFDRNLIIEELFNSWIDFDHALDDFLERTITLTWVAPSGKIFYINSSEIKDVYGKGVFQASAKRFTGIRLTEAGMAAFNQSFKNKNLQNSEDNKKSVYETAVKRYFQKGSYEHANYKRYPNQSQGNIQNTFYWHVGTHFLKWSKPIRVFSDIAEWYTEAVVNDDKSINASSKQEIELALAAFNANYVGRRHDNVAGIIKGDVIKNGTNNKEQFAVKQGTTDFSAASIQPSVDIANFIYNYDVSKEYLNDLFEKLAEKGVSGRLYKRIQEIIDEDIIKKHIDENLIKKIDIG